MTNDVLLTATEAAHQLQVHPQTIKNWHRLGKIKTIQVGIGGWIRVPQSEVDRILKEDKTCVFIDDGGCLVCPECGFNYLHQGKVDIYNREREDDEECLHIAIENGNVETVQSNNVGNPSSRRDGMTINFYCEGCQNEHLLTIAQHKGQTLVRWG